MTEPSGVSQAAPARSRLTATLVATMVLAVLFRAGQHPLALMALELMALGMLVTVLWRPMPLSRGEWVAVALLGLLPLLYLVPLPLAWVTQMSGRAPYLDAWRVAFGAEGLPWTATLSLIPDATESAWLTLAIPLAVFLVTRVLAPRELLVLVSALLTIAGAEAILGLMQYGSGPNSPLFFGLPYEHMAVGTYKNRNHLAGLLAMALPITLALLLYNVGRKRSRRSGARGRAAFLGSVRGQAALWYAALAILLLVAVTFTRSRMGLSMAMLGILLSVAAFSGRIGGDNAFGTVGTLVTIALGLAVTIGLVPVLDRFSIGDTIDDLRWTVFSDTLTAIGRFFPFGSGPGTYTAVFPAFQSPELGHWFVNHAHNDYLEWVADGGFAAIAVAAFLLYLYATQWRKVWSTAEWSRLRFVQVGSGIGILLILLHELVDYNLHTPANLVYFAVLVGIFFSDAPAAEPALSLRRLARTPRMGERTESAPGAADMPAQPAAAEQPKNPFLDD